MPVPEAIYVVSIASRTGWSEQFILWDLPLARGWQYCLWCDLNAGSRPHWLSDEEHAHEWVSAIRDKYRTLTNQQK